MLTPRGSEPTLGVSGPQAAASLVSADVWANVKVECEPSWQAFQGHCYRLQAEKRSWQESKKVCLRGGGDLLSIHSMAELEFITKQIKQGEEPPPQACPGGSSLPSPPLPVGKADLLTSPLPCRTPQRWRSCGLVSTT